MFDPESAIAAPRDANADPRTNEQLRGRLNQNKRIQSQLQQVRRSMIEGRSSLPEKD
jgi:hypothetical protein